MLEIVASAIGFLGASFIGISFISGTNRPRTPADASTALISPKVAH